MGGLELGGYLYIGNMFQMIGLQTIPADRAAFLLQLTTILVPLFQQIKQHYSSSSSRIIQKLPVLNNSDIQRNQRRQQQQKDRITVPLSPAINITPDDGNIPFSLWIACIVALFGVYLISIDTPSATTISSSTTTISWLDDILSTIPDTYNRLLNSGFNHPFDNTGTIWIIGAAIVYTFHCIRLEYYSQAIPPTVRSVYQLATAKVFSETFFSIITILGVVLYIKLAIVAGIYRCPNVQATIVYPTGIHPIHTIDNNDGTPVLDTIVVIQLLINSTNDDIGFMVVVDAEDVIIIALFWSCIYCTNRITSCPESYSNFVIGLKVMMVSVFGIVFEIDVA